MQVRDSGNYYITGLQMYRPQLYCHGSFGPVKELVRKTKIAGI